MVPVVQSRCSASTPGSSRAADTPARGPQVNAAPAAARVPCGCWGRGGCSHPASRRVVLGSSKGGPRRACGARRAHFAPG